ncbi:MASE1 domain-containing protein [Ramlibacter sp. USB13]|uniref:histidine kinase n=1 Tax=Ramlibacter cellulosilyticus TaxID=2764187 RepID=A0A923MS76_9BURK|nr:MASE1 domain-containing protein [Ramlibacter cellulosilyticus]MBC5783828.1 MASE1 domain-containing protein [Ramlibacter cellulosilyticus]
MREALEMRPTGWPDPAWALLRVAVLVGVGYYVGARIGLALTFEPMPVAVLWPPNSLLLAALILTPRRWWWAAIAGALPAHLLAELQGGVPLAMVLGWFASNVLEAAIGAAIVLRFSEARGLRTLRSVVAFCCAALLAPFLSSFVDAGLVLAIGWGEAEFATLWQMRFYSNVLAILIFVPVFLAWSAGEPVPLRQGSRGQIAEIAVLVAGLFAVSLAVFDSRLAPGATAPSLLYLPVPFLIWAALRFGPALTSAAYAIVAFLVIWGAAHGRGPFHAAALVYDALPIQLFLASLAVPLLLLAAVVEERREAERRLRASEELFATAFRQGPDAIALSRAADGLVIEANDRWLELLGYPLGTRPDAVAPFRDHLDDASRRRLQAMAAAPQQGADLEVAMRDCFGRQHAVLVAMAHVQVAGEPCSITILRDITQQRQAEKDARDQRRQLTHLTRVASLSDFSSTIAHELNQPLTAILANAQAALRFLQRDPPNVAEIRAILDEIADADKRAGLLIHHLRLLMKKGEEEFVQVDLNPLVRDVLDFIRGEFLLRGVDVKTAYGSDLPQVRGDRVQLQQVVLNLVCNACDAMQGQTQRRVVTLTTAQNAEGGVELTVSDTGPGISANQMERVFEPFYTTKESGLGMGLAICRRIAAAHGGTLSVQSRPGEGATFRFVLPAVVAAASALRPEDGSRRSIAAP